MRHRNVSTEMGTCQSGLAAGFLQRLAACFLHSACIREILLGSWVWCQKGRGTSMSPRKRSYTATLFQHICLAVPSVEGFDFFVEGDMSFIHVVGYLRAVAETSPL